MGFFDFLRGSTTELDDEIKELCIKVLAVEDINAFEELAYIVENSDEDFILREQALFSLGAIWNGGRPSTSMSLGAKAVLDLFDEKYSENKEFQSIIESATKNTDNYTKQLINAMNKIH